MARTIIVSRTIEKMGIDVTMFNKATKQADTIQVKILNDGIKENTKALLTAIVNTDEVKTMYASGYKVVDFEIVSSDFKVYEMNLGDFVKNAKVSDRPPVIK